MFVLVGLGLLITVTLSLFSKLGFESILNVPSLILVVVGTIGVSLISVPKEQFFQCIKLISAFINSKQDLKRIRQDILKLSKNKMAKLESHSPILVYVQELWDQGHNKDAFELFLYEKIRQIENESNKTVQSIRNISKYPPALGMMGSVVGLVSLFSSLNDKSTIGINLAIVLLTTLYGLIISNFFIMPAADRMEMVFENQQHKHEFMYQALIMINNGEHHFMIEEELNAAA